MKNLFCGSLLNTIGRALPLVAAGMFAVSAPTAEPPPARRLSRLQVFQPDYPRVFFFRASEGGPSRPNADYEAWDAEFRRLMGIMGKCLDEEVLGREARNPEFFSRFKQRHPEQVVLLHFNGNARDPRYHTEAYFPGHWIYRKATRILADVPAESGETVIKVEDARDFKVQTGRYKNANDDLALFGLTAEGKHDWNHCEQVQLLAVDVAAKSIRVKRGCYGTKPLAFQAGQARAAAHMTEGPWGRNNHLLWYYNFSTHCPKDAQGRNCADLLVEDLARWFGPDGKLAAFDGLEFDVFFHETHGDTDGDGELDHGIIQGLNQYGLGAIEFARKLRARMGDQFIIQGDGALGPGGVRSQRAWGLLNGIESEGFPNLNQWDMDDWSGGLNRHNFWQANARPPVFNYINHKWTEPVPGQPGEHKNPDVPFARHRLVFAAAQFTDAMLCYSFAPAREGKMTGIWDELRAGEAKQLGWLGQPEGPARRLAAATPDLLAGLNLAARVRGEVEVTRQGRALVITAKNPAAEKLNFTLADLPARGSNLLALATLRGEPRRGYPREMARFAQVEVSGGKLSLLGREPDEAGIGLRGQAEGPLDKNTGARVVFRPREKIGEQSFDAYSIHPPFQNGAKGYVYWTKDLEPPPNSELRFHLGMSEKAPERSDGVWFQVWAAELTAGKPGTFQKIFEQSHKAHAWLPCRVPLSAYAGKRVRLKFIADCGPKNNATTDQGFWGEVKVVAAGQDDAADTPAKAYMTWVNDRLFQSTFYYRQVGSARVNLAFQVEGAEPVVLESLELYAHPDAMCRVFEKGLVLANPSHAPYTFDLEALTPGRAYQRLQGTLGQDRETNNGQPVGRHVTLGERDALFLRRIN